MSPSSLPDLVRLERVTCTYGAAPVLVDIDLTITAGQFSGIVGPSGSGKTTLLRVLLGSVVPVAGTVQRRHGLRVGYVPQVETVNWSFPVTVSECVLMARTQGRIRRGAVGRNIQTSAKFLTDSISATLPAGTSVNCPAGSNNACSSPARW